GLDHFDECAGVVCVRVLSRGRNGAWIDVARKHGTAAGIGGRDRQHAAAGADVENATWPAGFQQTVEREPTTTRRAVMAGPEGQSRFDLDADPVDTDARAVMAAMHDETTRCDRLQSREAVGDPIALGNGFKGQRTRGRFARCRRNYLVYRGAVEWA